MRARGAVIAAILGVMLMSALYPLRQYQSQHSSVRALVAQEQALSRKISELRNQQNLLQSDGEIERIAREELGMVRPGEVAFAVVPGASSRSGAARSTAAVPATSGGGRNDAWYARWWHAVTHSFTGMH